MFRIARRQPPADWQPFPLSPVIPAMGNTTGGAGFVAGDMQNVNPLLGPLQKNGGPTATQALAPTSPTLDAIPASDAGCLAVDQRIVLRPQGTGCDIGAFEYQPVMPTIRAAQASTAGERVIFTGAGFQNGMTITLDGAPLAITVAADGKSFTAAVPAHVAGAVPLIVTNPGAALREHYADLHDAEFAARGKAYCRVRREPERPACHATRGRVSRRFIESPFILALTRGSAGDNRPDRGMSFPRSGHTGLLADVGIEC